MELNYKIIYSPKRKRASITVERDCSIVVKVPTNTPLEKIQEIVESKKKWIEKVKHLQKSQPQLTNKELVNGESLPYLGCDYKVELVDNLEEVQLICNLFLLPKVEIEKRTELFKNWYIQAAKETILSRIDIYSKKLGVQFNLVKFNESKCSWGSCASNNNITFNYCLIKAPMFVIDYVVVHELAHLIELNHSARFWNIVKVQIPTLEKAKQWLKENGEVLIQIP